MLYNGFYKSMSKVNIIILNWNNWGHTLRCLATLFQSTYENYNVILVENGSTDISLQKIREWIEGRIMAGAKILSDHPNAKPSKVYEYIHPDILSIQDVEEPVAKSLTIIKVEKNVGFARGCNLGITYALKDKTVEYILTLNNDMEIARDCVSLLVAEADSDKNVGACQAKVLLSETQGFIDGVGVNVTWYGCPELVGHGKADQGQYSRGYKIFGAYPATALFRKEMIKDIGLFDEDFFVYFEDVDLCLRARKSGWTTVLVPSAISYHFHSATYGKHSPEKMYYIVRNLLFYGIKNLPFPALMFFLILYYPKVVLTNIISSWKDIKALNAIMRGVKDGLFRIPHFWKKRKVLLRSTGHKVK